MKKPSHWKRRKMAFHNRLEMIPVRIVSDAAIHQPGVVGGKFVPVVILDTTDRPDIEEYDRVHQSYGAGDVVSTWGSSASKSKISLMLDVRRPLEIIIVLNFDVYKQTALISLILETGAVWIQPGRPGDRFSHDLTKGRILIEVADTGFRKHWLKERRRLTEKKFRLQGLSRTQAKAATETYYAKMSMMETFGDPPSKPDRGSPDLGDPRL